MIAKLHSSSSDLTGRCEAARPRGNDPTQQFEVPCGAYAEYCNSCQMFLCKGCHEDLGCRQDDLQVAERQQSAVLRQEIEKIKREMGHLYSAEEVAAIWNYCTFGD